MNQTQSLSSLKWIVLGILVYLNIGGFLTFLSCIIKIILAFSSQPIEALFISDILMIVLKLFILISAFNYLRKHISTFPENPSNLLLGNIIILPLLYLINAGLEILVSVYNARTLPVSIYANYAKFNSILSFAHSFINIIVLMAFGIVVLHLKGNPEEKG